MVAARPIKLIVAALGGQGGGVVSDWLIHVAKLENYLVQATSVPGVAQRTGATIYYLEFFPKSALPRDGREPVMALMPHPGDVDVVVASELMEAGRALLRGVVSRDKTTLIASSNRIYAMSEKIQLADGRADAERIEQWAREYSKRFILFDMQAIATVHGSVISAAMFGALAGSGALPFDRKSYRQAIEAGGIAVGQSLAAFDAAAQAAERGGEPMPAKKQPSVVYRSGPLPGPLATQLESTPPAVRPTVEEGVRRLIDYQDISYARLYMERLSPFLARDHESTTASRLTEAVARGLALWMSFEDTIRVADLKIRSTRARRVSDEIRAGAGQLVSVTEFMKPRVAEIYGTMPAGLAMRMQRSSSISRFVGRFTGSRQINTSNVCGFTLLYLLAGMRRWRRGTLRFRDEDTRIRAWLAEIEQVMASDYDLAVELAECQTLVRGYGETHERGTKHFDLIVTRARALLGGAGAAARVRELRLAAVADDEGIALARALEVA